MYEDSPIRVNHVGFMCHAPKTFIYLGKQNEAFSLDRLQDLHLIRAYEGILGKSPGGEMSQGLIGDFSAVTKPGIYRINCGDTNSRCFIIYDKVYDTVERVLFNYLSWQRCASNKGWNEACHTDDSITLDDGPVKDLSGGHHQSSDTRKWAWGTSLGAVGLLEYGLAVRPAWDDGEIAEEIRWSCDYFIKLIHDEGYLIDCTFVPEGWSPGIHVKNQGYGDYHVIWEKRQFYAKPGAAPAHWNVIRVLAQAARYFQTGYPGYAELCAASAEKIWRYMTEVADRKQIYTLPEYPPLGHEGMHKLFQGFYQDSALDAGGMLCAAMELYKTTGGESYAEFAQQSATKLCSLQADGNVYENLAAACFWESDGCKRLANNYFYFYNTCIPLGLADVSTAFPEHGDKELWIKTTVKIADQYVLAAKNNLFERLPGTWSAGGNDVFSSAAFFSFSTNEAEFKDDYKAGYVKTKSGESMDVNYKYFSFCYNLDLIAGAVFLNKMYALFKNRSYYVTAMKQIDWLLGANPYDASSVEGVGYNQPHRGIFGEFFPPVPQIPGAVFTGLTEESFNPKSYGYDCEYDMPMVTWLMYLFALLKNC